MTEIHLPSGIETIEKGAFYRCYALTSITIPETVTRIDTDVFFRCSSLRISQLILKTATIVILTEFCLTKTKQNLLLTPRERQKRNIRCQIQ